MFPLLGDRLTHPGTFPEKELNKRGIVGGLRFHLVVSILGVLRKKSPMRNPGLEPGSLAALEPESSASANSASSAYQSFWRQLTTISYI